MAKTFAEQLADLKATRAAKHEEMKAIGQKSIDEKRSMETGEAEQFDTIQGEIKRLDDDIKRISTLADMDNEAPLKGVSDAEQRDLPARGGSSLVPLQLREGPEKLEKGIAMARYAMCLVKSKGNHAMAFQMAAKYFPKTEGVVRTLKAQAEGANLGQLMQMKATVAAGDTVNATWAAPLVDVATFTGDFIEFLRPRTLIGQANFRQVPFNVRIAAATAGGTAYWVGQGKAKPVTSFGFGDTTVPFTKVAAIAVITQELARFSDPNAEALVRDMLADAVIERIDVDLLDPDKAAVANVSPAGLLNGVTPVATGAIDPGDPVSVRCAIALLWAQWDSTYLGMRPAYYTTPAVARMLAFSRDPLGTRAFPEMTPQGGSLDGVPVRVSQYLANNGGSGGAILALIDEAEIFLADDGSVTVDASEQASIEMSDAPAGSSNPTVAASSVNLVSMWQTNSIALRAERFIWWGKRRAGAAQWIDGFPTSC
jgi:HK97 family phage major capsid protein